MKEIQVITNLVESSPSYHTILTIFNIYIHTKVLK